MKQRKDCLIDYQSFLNKEGKYDCTCRTCGKVESVSRQTMKRRHSGEIECRSCAQKKQYLLKEDTFRAAQKAYAASIKIERLPGEMISRADKRAWAHKVHISWNFTCAACGSNKKLEAHHIIPQAYSPENALVVANGISLCTVCHRNLHKSIGAIRREQ